MTLDVGEADLDDETFLQAWSRLAIAAENPFSTPHWHEAWMQTRHGVTGLVLAVHSGVELTGVVPLVVERRCGLRLVSGAGSNLADFSGPACRPEDERAVGAAVTEYMVDILGQRDIWLVERCLVGSAWERALVDAGTAHQLLVRDWRSDNVLVQVALSPGSSPMRRGRDRREIDRLSRKLQQSHDVTFRMSDARTAADDVRALLALRRARWTQEPGQEEDEFLVALAQRAAVARLLRMWVLEEDGRMVAGLLGWGLNGRTFAHLMAFDAQYARFGPGAILLSQVVRSALDAGDHTVDFLRGDEAHKRAYVTEHRQVRSHLVTRRRSLAGCAVLGAALGQGVYRRLPPVWRDRLRRALPPQTARTTPHAPAVSLQGPKPTDVHDRDR